MGTGGEEFAFQGTSILVRTKEANARGYFSSGVICLNSYRTRHTPVYHSYTWLVNGSLAASAFPDAKALHTRFVTKR